MLLEEIIEQIQYKRLNQKCNHLIFSGLKELEVETIIEQVPSKTLITNSEEINFAFSYSKQMKLLSNILIDIQTIDMQNLLNTVLKQLQIEAQLPFENRKSLFKFLSILRNYEKCIQLIAIQNQALDKENQKLFNELFAFNSYFLSVTYLLKEYDELSTYQTLHGEMLDDRENYQKIQIMRLNNTK